MSTLVKVGILAAIVGVAYLGFNKAKALISAFTFSISRYGIPQIKNSVVYLPILVHFKNPSTVPLSIDQIFAEIFLWKVNTYQKVAQVSQPLSIPPGESDQTVNAAISLSDLFGGNIVATLQNIFGTKKASIRTTVTITYAGVSLPSQSFDQTVDITSL